MLNLLSVSPWARLWYELWWGGHQKSIGHFLMGVRMCTENINKQQVSSSEKFKRWGWWRRGKVTRLQKSKHFFIIRARACKAHLHEAVFSIWSPDNPDCGCECGCERDCTTRLTALDKWWIKKRQWLQRVSVSFEKGHTVCVRLVSRSLCWTSCLQLSIVTLITQEDEDSTYQELLPL